MLYPLYPLNPQYPHHSKRQRLHVNMIIEFQYLAVSIVFAIPVILTAPASYEDSGYRWNVGDEVGASTWKRNILLRSKMFDLCRMILNKRAS